jgi:hypothetical protein
MHTNESLVRLGRIVVAESSRTIIPPYGNALAIFVTSREFGLILSKRREPIGHHNANQRTA